jgi:drug/metabolite transporter (DMT)-like permease
MQSTAAAQKRSARLQLLGSGILFGLMAVAIRAASSGPGGFSGGQATFIRFAFGALACLAVFRLRPGSFQPRNKLLLVARGVLGGTSVLLYFIALARIPAGDATLLNNIFPIFATLLSIFLIHERPTLRIATALAITVVGVYLVLGRGGLTLGLGVGEIAGFVSSIFAALAVIAIRALRATVNALTIFFSFCVFGMLISLPMSFGPLPTEPRIWALMLAGAVVSIGAQLLMTHAYGALTVPEASIWQQISPVASYLFALPLLGERLTLLSTVGVLLVIAGVAWGAAQDDRVAAKQAPKIEPPA